MKLGFSTLGCPEWSWKEILDTARDMGIDGIEIRGVEEEIDPMKICIFDREHLAGTMKQLKSSGIEIPLLASSICLGGAQGKEQATEAKNHIDFASANNIPFVRVLISMEAEPQPVDLEAARVIYNELCTYAKVAGNNVRVLVETSGALADSTKMAEFILQAEPQTRGVLWDIQHPYRYFKEKPQETCDRLGKDIYYVHVKDSVLENGTVEYRMMGLGDVPIFDAVKALNKIGYEGYLMLEWVKRWRPELRDPDVIFYHYQSYMETLLEEIEGQK